MFGHVIRIVLPFLDTGNRHAHNAVVCINAAGIRSEFLNYVGKRCDGRLTCHFSVEKNGDLASCLELASAVLSTSHDHA